ncbi:MAG: branched-chain-amino-acid transaminase [Candidatus Hydrothermarchaeota archaeon]
MREPLVFINGELVPKKEAKVSVFDHGYLYGDGVFEGIRAYNGRVFKLNEHIDRLYESAHTIMLKIPISKEEMKENVLKTLRANGLKDSYIRLVVSRGEGDLGLDPRKCEGNATIVIIAERLELYDQSDVGIKIITASTRNRSPDCLSPNIKTLNYLSNILAKIEAIQANAQEAIMLDSRGFVAECTGDNIFFVKKRTIFTPPVHNILKGITREVVFQIANEFKVPIIERECTLHELYNADEVFLTGTGAEIVPVVEIDGRRIGNGKPGELTKRILSRFREITQTEGVPI